MLKRWRPPCCGIQTGPQPQRWVTFNSKNTTRPGCWKEKQNGMSQVPIKSRKVHRTTTWKCWLKKISCSLPIVLWLTTFEWIGNLPLIRPNVVKTTGCFKKWTTSTSKSKKMQLNKQKLERHINKVMELYIYISFLHTLEVTKFQKRKTSSQIYSRNALLLIIHRKCVLVHKNPSTKECRNSLVHTAILWKEASQTKISPTSWA